MWCRHRDRARACTRTAGTIVLGVSGLQAATFHGAGVMESSIPTAYQCACAGGKVASGRTRAAPCIQVSHSSTPLYVDYTGYNTCVTHSSMCLIVTLALVSLRSLATDCMRAINPVQSLSLATNRRLIVPQCISHVTRKTTSLLRQFMMSLARRARAAGGPGPARAAARPSAGGLSLIHI